MGYNLLEQIAMEQTQIKKEVTEAGKKYLNYVLDISEPIHEPKFLFSIDGVPTIPQGELIAFKGRAKQGKSQFEYLLVSAMLAAEPRGNIKPLQDRYKVLLFDTEQSQASLKKCVQRALKYADLPTDKNSSSFLPFFLRPLSIEERKATIEEAISAEKPDIVFIDGVRDLLQDFNSLEQSGELIQWLLRLTADSGCAIVSVLHQNKAKEDGNMRGHLGTELLNKVTDCFEVSKKDGKFVVTCTDSRNVPCGDTSFSIDADGNFQPEETGADEKKNAKQSADIQRVLNLCFEKSDEYGYRELITAYALEDFSSESTAKRRIGLAKEKGFIKVGSNGKYSLNLPKSEKCLTAP